MKLIQAYLISTKKLSLKYSLSDSKYIILKYENLKYDKDRETAAKDKKGSAENTY